MQMAVLGEQQQEEPKPHEVPANLARNSLALRQALYGVMPQACWNDGEPCADAQSWATGYCDAVDGSVRISLEEAAPGILKRVARRCAEECMPKRQEAERMARFGNPVVGMASRQQAGI